MFKDIFTTVLNLLEAGRYDEVKQVIPALDRYSKQGTWSLIAKSYAEAGDFAYAFQIANEIPDEKYRESALDSINLLLAHSQIKAGDFYGVLETADKLPPFAKDELLQDVALQQINRGQFRNALNTISKITVDNLRQDLEFTLFNEIEDRVVHLRPEDNNDSFKKLFSEKNCAASLNLLSEWISTNATFEQKQQFIEALGLSENIVEQIQNANSSLIIKFQSAANIRVEQLRKEKLGKYWNVEFSAHNDRHEKQRLKWRVPPNTWDWVSKKDFENLAIDLKDLESSDWCLFIADETSKTLLRKGIEVASLQLSKSPIQRNIEPIPS